MSRNNAGAEMGEDGGERGRGAQYCRGESAHARMAHMQSEVDKSQLQNCKAALSTRETKRCYLFISVVQSINEVGGPLRGGGAGAKLDGKEPATRRSGEEHSKLRETAKCKGPTAGKNRKKAIVSERERKWGGAVSTMRSEGFQVLDHTGLGRESHSKALAFISDATGSPH